MDDGAPQPSDTPAPPGPAARRASPAKPAPAKKATGKTPAKTPRTAGTAAKSAGSSNGSATKRAAARATPRPSSTSSLGASNGATRRPTAVDPLLSQPVPVAAARPARLDPIIQPELIRPIDLAEVADPPVVDPDDERIDRLFIDERSADTVSGAAPVTVPLPLPPMPDEVMPVDESGRIELPAIVRADLALDPDDEADFGTELPTEQVPAALLTHVADPEPVLVGVLPFLDVPIDEPFVDPDGTGGLPAMQRPVRPARGLRAPKVLRRSRRPRVRRVTRIVRQVDTWSVFKVALVFSLFLYGVLLTAGVLLWKVAQNTGTVDNIQRFFESFGWKSFQLKGGEIFHQAWTGGLFVVIGLTGFAVLVATLFNLITDLVGGIRVTVLEEEVVAREDRGLGWRRGKGDPAPAEGENPGADSAG